jgi:hypothetical protein
MSQAHLKRGLPQLVKEHWVKAPSFKAIFDWHREKGLGMSSNIKASKNLFAKVYS